MPKASLPKKKPNSSIPPQTKTTQIKTLLQQGLGVSEIAKRLHVSRTLVYRAKESLDASEPQRILLSQVPQQQISLKAADFFRANVGDVPVQLYECAFCGRNMWGDDPARNDLCEDCAIKIMHEAQEAMALRGEERFVNPFDNSTPGHEFGDFDGNTLKVL